MKPKLWKAIENDDLRPAMCHALVTKEDVVVSNSSILVKHRTIDLFDEAFCKAVPPGGMFLSEFVLKEMSKPSFTHGKISPNKRDIELSHITKKVAYTVVAPIEYVANHKKELKKPVDQYPNYNAVIPKLEKFTDRIDVVGISPVLLKDLMDAMGAYKRLTLRFGKANSNAIFVKSDDEAYQCVGLIMPMMPIEDK